MVAPTFVTVKTSCNSIRRVEPGSHPPGAPTELGRAQLRHPVPLVKVSLGTLPNRFRYPSELRLDTSLDFCASFNIFPSKSPFSRRSPSLLYKSGSLRSRFPCVRYYDCATTAHCPSRSLRFSYSYGTVGLLLFRITCYLQLLITRLFTLRAGVKPGVLVSRLVLRRPFTSRGNEPSHVPV